MELTDMVEVCELNSTCFRQGPVVESCEHGNETLHCTEGGEFIDHQNVLSLSQKKTIL
jgi:hypothetical protein